MNTTTSFLDRIDVAKPCEANWADMTGDDRVRNCALCKLDVYDLSAMSRPEAEAFVGARLGSERTCIRFFRRADGTVLTSNCPVGLRAAWKRVTWAAAALLAGGFAIAAMIAPRGTGGRPTVAPLKQMYEFVENQLGTPAPVTPKMGDFLVPPQPEPPVPPDPSPIMGKLAAPEVIETRGEMIAAPLK